ncbi:MAG: hypothetical protein LUE11_12970 [Clostridia bacterium]|nr:hypothetical protein [Clostridia bacterium]
MAKAIDFSELQGKIKFDDMHNVIEVPEEDMKIFMVIISEEVDMKGLSEDQQEITSYGRKLYGLYDEVYALKCEQS